MRPRRHARAWPRRTAAVTVLGLLAAACQGPQAPLVVGMNDQTVDLLLGERVRVVTEVVPPALPLDLLPAPTVVRSGSQRVEQPTPEPIYVTAPPKESPLPPCTPPEEIVIPAEASALQDPAGPPAPATYEFDTVGFVLYVEPGEEPPAVPPDAEDVPLGSVVLPLKTKRTIAAVTAEPTVPVTGADGQTGTLRPFTFDVVWEAGERTSTSSYRLVVGPRPVVAPEAVATALPREASTPLDRAEGAETLQPGLYLTQGDRETAGGFHPPAPGMKILEFPVVPGQRFEATASDAVTTMTYSSTVGFSTQVVNACGTWLEGWPVTLEGTVVSTDPEFLGHQLVEFTARYLVAPQFGGLILDESVEVRTPDDGTGAALPLRVSNATIAAAPQPALTPEQVE